MTNNIIRTITEDPKRWPEEGECFFILINDWISEQKREHDWVFTPDKCDNDDGFQMDELVGCKFFYRKDLNKIFDGTLIPVERTDLESVKFSLDYSKEFVSASHKEPHIEDAIKKLTTLLQQGEDNTTLRLQLTSGRSCWRRP